MYLLVKTAVNSVYLEDEIAKLAKDQNPNVPVGRLQPMEHVVSGSISDLRSTILVFISFAGTSMLLAAIGVYGLMSYWVMQRIYEIGVRLAIGATRLQIVSSVLTQALRISLYGIGVGVMAALLLTRFLRSLLYGIGSIDPIHL